MISGGSTIDSADVQYANRSVRESERAYAQAGEVRALVDHHAVIRPGAPALGPAHRQDARIALRLEGVDDQQPERDEDPGDRRPGRHGDDEAGSLHALRPTTHYDFTPDGFSEAAVVVARIGNTVFAGLQAELNAGTGLDLKAASPFPATCVVTMVNRAAKYMADAGSYERITYEAMNSRYAKGAAETVTARHVELLRNSDPGDAAPGSKPGASPSQSTLAVRQFLPLVTTHLPPAQLPTVS
ncbi:hypothetical protein [Streptomyces sp. NPDC051572]|uniref:hypothetical protein n=1 Tax=Streptomyces sp. NPDC051572 TaxID=3155802 RepID=UPI00344DA752